MKPQHFVGIDIGTSEVRCVVGMHDPKNNQPSIIGHGSSVNQGMRRGAVVNVDEVAESISQAVHEAERIAGVPIRSATINVNGGHVTGVDSQGVIAISAANREITSEDRMRVDDAATIVNLPQNREIVQFFAKYYSLDGQKNIKDPVSMHGIRLEVEAHIVTASSPNMRSLDLALEKAGIEISHHSVSSLASAEAVMTRQQKEAGTILLDIGSGTTNLIVFEDGDVQYVSVIPIGGQHITNDLAIGLKTDLDSAEEVKLKYGTLKEGHKGVSRLIKTEKSGETFISDDVRMIIESRVDELFDLVEKELHKIKKFRKLPGGVVLTGGSAKLPGIVQYAKEKLQLSTRIGRVHGIGGLVDTVEDPSYDTVIGLMILDLLMLPALPQNSSNYSIEGARNVFKSVFGKLKN